MREINIFHMEEISTLWRTKRIAAFFSPMVQHDRGVAGGLFAGHLHNLAFYGAKIRHFGLYALGGKIFDRNVIGRG